MVDGESDSSDPDVWARSEIARGGQLLFSLSPNPGDEDLEGIARYARDLASPMIVITTLVADDILNMQFSMPGDAVDTRAVLDSMLATWQWG